MKTIFIISIISMVTFTGMTAHAQDKNKTNSIQFGVRGNCEMCKKNIETALDVKGVKSAVWNQNTKKVDITYLPDKISIEKLHQLIANIGYDTDSLKAKDEVYKSLPDCCQYTRGK